MGNNMVVMADLESTSHIATRGDGPPAAAPVVDVTMIDAKIDINEAASEEGAGTEPLKITSSYIINNGLYMKKRRQQPNHAHASQSGLSIPPYIYLINLAKLDISDFPLDLLQFKNLNNLDLSQNKLRTIDRRIQRLVHLERLALGNNELVYLPDELFKLHNLVWLDLTHNKLIQLPENIHELSRIAGLGISDSRLVKLPESFGQLSNLQKLGIYNNRLTFLPSSFGLLRNLIKLDLSHNLLEYLPDNFGSLTSLTWLNLTGNSLKTLPPSFSNLKNLLELGLSENQLTDLPDLSSFSELTILPLYKNKLSELPQWLARMPNVKKIDASFNLITTIPHCLFQHPSLVNLNVSYNRLESIGDDAAPRNMSTFPLTRLDVTKNPRLYYLPQFLVNLPNLSQLIVDSNVILEEFERINNASIIPREPFLLQAIPSLKQLCLKELFKVSKSIGEQRNALHGLKPWSSIFPSCQPDCCAFSELKDRMSSIVLDDLMLCQKEHHKCYNCEVPFRNTPVCYVHLFPVSADSKFPIKVQFCSELCAFNLSVSHNNNMIVLYI